MILEILLILILILLNGVLAMAEISLVSSREARLRQRAEAGDRGARTALELSENPSRFLSTVQIGITLVGILAGAFGGATLSEELGARLAALPGLERHGEAVGFAIVVAGITYLSLILGELVPKQIGLRSPETIASTLARPIRLLSRMSAPLVSLLEGSTSLILKMLGIRPSEEPPVSDEEIRLLLEQGTLAGVFDAGEREIAQRALQLADRRVGELMTPRSQVVALDLDGALEEHLDRMAESGHSYFPVYQESLDQVLGMVSVKDVWPRVLRGESFRLDEVLTTSLYLPETLPAHKALEALRSHGSPIALVLDEYGGVEGVITLNDLIQAVVGEISSVTEGSSMAVRRPDGSWLFDGLLPTGEAAHLLEIGGAEAEEITEFQTLGGFVMARVSRVPQEGDRFEWQGYAFEVVDMDLRRVDKLLVRRVEEEREEG